LRRKRRNVWPDSAFRNFFRGPRINLEAKFPLDGLIKGGILKIAGGARDSRVTDPITGQEQRITSDLDYNWNIDFRQDLPEFKLAWGGDYTGSGENDVFRQPLPRRRLHGLRISGTDTRSDLHLHGDRIALSCLLEAAARN
jgi:hypothetical protein